ncbi:MAG: 3-hydroxyacyl-ACP dehydratase FabZ family protein [Gemmataceae bacterium]
MPSEPILDLSTLDINRIVADREAIRAVNPQRFEMEQLDAIVLFDPDRKMIAGYKDVRDDEFWARGHMPGNPLMPGVLMCEAAAQLCSYYVVTQHILGDDHILGFGGMDGVRFRTTVRPGERLVLIARAEKLKRVACVFLVQGYVGTTLAFEGQILGMALSARAG